MNGPRLSLSRPVAVLLVAWTTGMAADWPTYRYDARRSACSPDELPATLQPIWRRSFPAFLPAFPNEPRQQFDRSYEPVCADGVVVIGSPVDGSVRAFSAETGEVLWQHYTEGPVRLAPVLHNGRALVGSDDGTFRCLNLADGALVWRARAYPADRPDLRLLGNNRLISMWPVRGGPVVVDDVVYFASGMWPTMGVYVHALRADDGSRVWDNPQLSLMTNVRIDHNKLFDAGIAPQGYLVAAKEKLLLPNGRSHPLALNRTDGTLFHFVQGYRNGDSRVAVGGNYAFVGERGVVSLADVREVGNKWVRAGDAAPGAFDAGRFDQFEGPFHPYKHFAGCDADSVFDGATAYSLAHGTLYAHDLASAAVSEWESKQGNAILKPFRWDAPTRIRVPTGIPGASRFFLKAGKRLYGHAGYTAVALELTDGTPAARVVWKHELGSKPTSMIAASGQLFVMLQDGTLQCFGEPGTNPPALESAVAAVTPAPSPELGAILDIVNGSGGICVVLGGLAPSEAAALLARTRMRLIVVDADAGRVRGFRDSFGQTGAYGSRIEAFEDGSNSIELPAYVADVFWVRLDRTGVNSVADIRRAWRSVHPYGGRLCATGSATNVSEFGKLAATLHLQGASAQRQTDGCVVVERPEGPEGAADWTHETADPARSHFSRDTAVRAPLAPLWYGDGPGHGFFKQKDYGRGVKPQVVQGRVFALQQISRTLFAYDAYTGRLLWTQRSDGKDTGFITRFASRPEGIYTAGKGLCVVYDPASGRELRRFCFAEVMENESGARAAGIVVTDASILIAGANTDTGAIEKGLWDADMLICFERKTGRLKWKREAVERFNIKALAAGSDLVFCTDSMAPLATERWKSRARGAKQCPSTVLALDEATGEVRWQHEYSATYRQHGASGWLGLRGTDDWLAYVTADGRLLAGREQTAMLFAAADGSVVWEKPLRLSQPLIIRGEDVIDQGGRLVNVESGEILRGGLFHRGGCNYAVANQQLLFLRDQTVCYVDIETGKQQHLRNMRSGCSNSTVPACGVLSIPNFAVGCVCNYPVQTSSAWIHRAGIESWGGTEPVTVQPVRVETGIPLVSAETAAEMHAFKRRLLVTDPDKATEHLLGQWTFEQDAEAKPGRIPDLSGNDAHCTVYNAAFEPRAGGQALTCGSDTARTHGTAPVASPHTVREALTLSAWVKLGQTQHKSATGIVECPQYYRLMVDNTEPPYTISFSIQTDAKAWRSVRTKADIQPGEWVHVAGTFDSEVAELVLYLNGKQVERVTAPPCRIGPSGGQLAIGVRDGGAFLNGAVDDVRLYDRALAPAVIASVVGAE